MTPPVAQESNRSRSRGQIVIISSPSGGGKTSICRSLLTEQRTAEGWRFSVSYTTRGRRPGEENGREYFFVDDAEFSRLESAGFFAEAFQVHSYRYGTPRQPVDEIVTSGGVMLLDVDVQGAFRLKDEFPDAITIFILPPSIAELQKRLTLRGTETTDQLKVRFVNATREISLYDRFEYAVINKELETAVAQVLAIIVSHTCRTENLSAEQIEPLLVNIR